MMNKVKIHINYFYGGWNLYFDKHFNLPFTPQLGIHIVEEIPNEKGDIDYDNMIRFVNNEYQQTDVYYYPLSDEYEVEIRKKLPHGCAVEEIDNIIKNYKNLKWERTDTTDLDKFKELLIREYH